ncbi:DNA-processing protein DprA [Segniliparus rotundus]|uniref:DNA-processing protein DprA n=1 Tax=Segniliparus rotundus TaxID=286802 RepID=UPI0002F5066B|nr:DNA-processing protein DprA [Segniliparus rotundus]
MRRDERELAWAYLSRVVEPPCPELIEFLKERDVVEAARLISKDELPHEQRKLRELTCARRECDFARHDLEKITQLGGRLITADSPDWPAWRLLAFEQARARDGGGHHRLALAEPLALWTLGDIDLATATGFSCAVVGTRASTGYGERVAAQWSCEIAEAGGAVISGGAYGVDAAAHRGALAGGGTTLALLACGVDVPYSASPKGTF